MENRRVDGSIKILLPGNTGTADMTVVDRYKHLGSITAICGSEMYEVQHRCADAIDAYGPLACKIFGSPKIGTWLKLHFMNSLVMTKLLYCVHTLTLRPNAIGNTRLQMTARPAPCLSRLALGALLPHAYLPCRSASLQRYGHSETEETTWDTACKQQNFQLCSPRP